MPSVSLLNDQFSHDFQYVLALTRYDFDGKLCSPQNLIALRYVNLAGLDCGGGYGDVDIRDSMRAVP